MKSFYALCPMLALLVACDGDHQGTGAGNGVVATNIQNAQSLLLAEESERRELLQLSEEGIVQNVEFYDQFGEQVDLSASPDGVYNINDDYVIIHFDDYFTDGPRFAFLIRQDTGTVFVLREGYYGIVGAAAISNADAIVNRRRYQTDASGNIYFRSAGENASGRRVARVDLSDSDKPTVSYITPVNDVVQSFEVRREGDVIYRSHPENVNQEGIKVRQADGSFSVMPTQIIVFWSDSVGDLFVVQQEDSTVLAVNEVQPEGSAQHTLDPRGTFMSTTLPEGFLIKTRDRVFLVSAGSPVQLYELNNPNGAPRRVDSQLASLVDVASSDDFIYVSGQRQSDQQPTLQKLRASDVTDAVDIFDDGAYVIHDIAVQKNERITASALRLADGKYVVLDIDASEDAGPFPIDVIETVPEEEPVVLECIRNCGT